MSSISPDRGDRGWEPAAPGDWDYRPVGPIPLDRFGDEFLALYLPPLRSKNTYIKVRQVLEIIEAVAGPGATTAYLTPTLISRLIESRPAGESPRTTQGILAYARVACNYAKMSGYLRTSPFEFRKKWLRVGTPEGKRHHSLQEIRAVLDLLEWEFVRSSGWARWRARRLYAMVSTFAYTGLRRDEGLYLHAEDVDLDRGMIFLRERNGRRLKTEASAQPVPMPPPLAAILERWLDHRMDVEEGGRNFKSRSGDCPWLFPGVSRKGAWTGGEMGHRPIDQVKAAGERAGVQGLSFLSFRHSFATNAAAWGLTPEMVKRVLRHTSIRTQKHYVHPDLDGMRAAVDGIRFDPPAWPGPEGGEVDAT